jgi:hypothetical protein
MKLWRFFPTILIILTLTVACGSEKPDESAVQNQYPDLTKEKVRKELPVYPGAELEKKLAPQDMNIQKNQPDQKTDWDDAVVKLGQGIENFSFLTEDDVRTINDYYEQEFNKGGWRRMQLNRGDGPKGNNAALQQYEKGNQRITMMIRPHSSGKNKVQIILQDKSASK